MVTVAEPQITFVLARGQNAFFVELVAALRAELGDLGVPSTVVSGAFPAPAPDRVFVVLPPHEFAALEPGSEWTNPAITARTMVICAEQPESEWFAGNVVHAARAAAVFDINLRGVAALARHGVAARLLPIGYARAWDTSTDDPDWDGGRDVDVLVLASRTHHRDEVLARCGLQLQGWRTEIVLSDNMAPNTDGSTNFVAGDDKWQLLRRTRVLLNIHRGAEPYFEWLRVIEAVHGGAVVVTEPSLDTAPLVAGRHLLVARPLALPFVLDAALRNDLRLHRLRRSALDALRARPLAAAAALLAQTAAVLTDRPLPASRPSVVTAALPALGPPVAPVPVGDDPVSGRRAADAALRQSVKAMRLEVLDLRRALTARELLAQGVHHRVEVVASTPAYRALNAVDVSVITAMYRHGHPTEAALTSVARSTGVVAESVVVDDGSDDDSSTVVEAWMRRHPHVPVVLVRHPVNRGLGAARNTAIDLARADRVFVLDADNEVYPGGLEQLSGALDRSGAAFAYGMLECFDDHHGSTHLLSVQDWEPTRLRHGNFIDAMAMIRVDALRQVGGFTTELRLYGWEDYDLWCAMADHGLDGSLVRRIIGRYRQDATSMRSITDIDHADARACLRERRPALMGGPG